MQLASQCLRYLNRARLGRCLRHLGLDASRRAASSLPTTPCTNFCSSGARTRTSAAYSQVQTGLPPHLSSGISSTNLDATTVQGSLKPWKAGPATRSPKTQGKERLSTVDYSAKYWTDREAGLGLWNTPENDNSISPWIGILNAAKRERGREGVLAIWRVMEQRKKIYEADSKESEAFWSTILEAVLGDESLLQRVALYAEWMSDVHSVQWPHLYSMTISFYLRSGQYRRAMQWHMRLVPKFDPGSEVFSDLFRQFVTSSDTLLQQTLQSLYVSTFHHSLYDEVIPLLFESGASRLCGQWRELFLRFHDFPQLTAKSQPYLRFLVRFYPGTSLQLEEQLVLEANSSAYWDFKHDSLWDAMNGMHDEDDGPTGRRYSDKLGARWFASSWIPMDFAIHAVHALGVHQIGPLSLQSIALREPSPEGVMARIEQLRKVGISIGHSTYALAVRHFAETADNELLYQLLHTDIHPDVFDDAQMLQSIRDEAFESGAWQIHRLLLAIQPALAQESIESTSNLLLQQRLQQHQNRQALALMDDMRSMNIDLSAASVQHICSDVLEPLSWNPEIHPANWRSLQDAIAFLNRMMLLQKPVPACYWQKVFFSLGKFGRLDDLEDLVLGVFDAYQARNATSGGLLPLHPMDTPPASIGGLGESVVFPTDLPVAHNYHPMRQIFDKSSLHVAIIRWGFKAAMSKDPARRTPSGTLPAEMFIVRGVQLLAKLEERGIPFNPSAIREEVIRYLVHLYRPRTKRVEALPELAVMRKKINAAAELASRRKLLPGIHTLRDLITRYEGERHRKNHLKRYTSLKT